mgnify:CR=1 FL=1
MARYGVCPKGVILANPLFGVIGVIRSSAVRQHLCTHPPRQRPNPPWLGAESPLVGSEPPWWGYALWL